jgi:hypothetical protein
LPDPGVIDAIRRAARRHGIPEETALAIAERESSFNPNGRAPGSSAYGLFQLLKRERAQYGGSTEDPEEQAEAWGRYAEDLKAEMAKHLGRDPTGAELYAGHFWGGARGARLATGQIPPETSVSDAFTPQELAANPNIVRAGTTGALTSSVMGDINRRQAKWGGDGSAQTQSLAQFGEEAPVSLAQFGEEPPAAKPVGITPTPYATKGPEDAAEEIVGQLDKSNKGTGWFDNMLATAPKSTNVEDRRLEPQSFADRWPDPDETVTQPTGTP